MQLHQFGHISARIDKAVVGFSHVVHHEEDSARLADTAHGAGIGVVDMDGIGVVFGRQGQGKGKGGRDGGREKTEGFHVSGPVLM
jgi:hypothetical protein